MRSTKVDSFLLLSTNILLLAFVLWLWHELGDSFSYWIVMLGVLAGLTLNLSFYLARDLKNDIQRLIENRLNGSPCAILRDSPAGRHTAFKKLIVLIHGYQSSPVHLHHLVRTIVTTPEMDDAQILVFSYDATRFSTHRLWDITYSLYECIGRYASDDPHKEIDDIVLVGHSVGALIARKLLIFSRGEGEAGGRLNMRPRRTAWGAKIRTKLILLAGMTRGWDLKTHPPHMPIYDWYLYRTLIAIARFRGQKLLVFDAEKGSPFVSNLRLQWFRVTQAALKEEADARKTGKTERKFPTVIQILGTYDDFINSADHNDAQAGPFVLQIAEKTGHYDIISFRQPTLWKRLIRPARYRNHSWKNRETLFRTALSTPPENLRDDLEPDLKVKPVPSVENLVIVLHGIRDNGEWADRLNHLGEERDYNSITPPVTDVSDYENKRTFKCWIAAYDRLSMLEFLSSLDRKRAARCLVDAFTEARFIYTNPKLKIHFVGHSNGTYGLGETLTNYTECTFERIVLGGSVLPYGYGWQDRFKRGSFKEMKNYVAKDDCIVALLPKGLELARHFPILDHDVGGGGFEGFKDDIARQHPVYLHGGHGAITHREPTTTPSKNSIDHIYNSMLDFILDGIHTNVPPDMQLPASSPRLTFFSTQSYWIWYLTPVICLLLWAGVLAGCYWALTWVMAGWWQDGLVDHPWVVPTALFIVAFLQGIVFRKVLQTI